MMHQSKPLVYFNNLDALRAIAALSVIFYHIGTHITFPEGKFYNILKFIFSFGGDGGSLGVIFFFILSGFLITYLMFVEKTQNGTLNVFHFYLRRILRIWPLYYFTLFFGFLIYPLISSQEESASLLLYSIFATNFDHIYNGYPLCGILGVQWSVAIEEQFYFIWPLLFYFTWNKKLYPYVLIVLIILSELFFIRAKSWEVGHYHLISNFRFLAFGALLAHISYHEKNKVDNFLNLLNRKTHIIIYLICVPLILFNKSLAETFNIFKYFYHILPFLFFGFVILEQNYSRHSFFKIGRVQILNQLGKISYGLYLTHMIAIYIVVWLFPTQNRDYSLLKAVLVLLLTIIISQLSYRYFESHFLKLKNRFSKTATPAHLKKSGST